MAGWLLNLGSVTAPSKSGTGSLSSSAKATARAGAKARTGNGSVAASGTLTGRAGAKARSGSGTLAASPTVRARAGTKARTGQAALAASGKATARTGAKARTGTATLATQSSTLTARGVKTRTGTGQLVTTAALAAHAGAHGGTGRARLTGYGVLTVRIGNRASSAHGTLSALGYVHALAGGEGDFGSAVLTPAVGLLRVTTGTVHVIPVERSGAAHLTGSGEVHARAGTSVVYLITGIARLITTSSISSAGFSCRVGRATTITVSALLSAQGLPYTREPVEVVRHLALVIAGGQGYLPRGTYLAPNAEGKYVVGDDTDDNAILLRSGLNATGGDVRIAGGIRSESSGPPSIYACVATTL